jgi:GNAT superfamily N-acetyltransferase
MADKVVVKPATPERWPDLEEFMGSQNPDKTCWCMFSRIKVSEFQANGPKGNRAALKALVDANRVPGLIAYLGSKPVGWISVALRAEYGRIDRSAIYKPVDNKVAWAIVCLLVHADHRREGISEALIRAATDYARSHGAEVVEAYPSETQGKERPAQKLFYGTDTMYSRAGFKEVARNKSTRPIFRKSVK